MTRKAIILAAVFVAIAAPAGAQLFGGSIVFDATNALKFAQQLQNQATQIQQGVTSLANEAKNLQTLPRSYQDVQSEVSAIAQTGKQVAAATGGTVAAATVVNGSAADAAETARLNGLASKANGAQQEAIVANGYAAQANGLLEKGNALQAQGQLQHAAEERADYEGFAAIGTAIGQAGHETVPNDL